jgi:outer membrane lipoprotein-sorting protein
MMTADEIADRHFDEMLRHNYEAIRKTVPAQRQAVLSGFDSIRAEVSGGGSRPAVDGPEGPMPMPFAPHVRRLRAMRLASISAVAVIAAMAVVLFRWTPSGGTAYGIDGLPDRLQQVHSISLRGWRWMYNQSPANPLPVRTPFELRIQRPGKFRNSSTTSSTKNGRSELRIQLHLCDGKREWLADEAGKPLFVLRTLSPLDAQLKTEYLAQIAAMTAVLGPAESQYRKIGLDSADGRRCDVYEARFAIGRHTTVSKVWLDPQTGFPVRVVRDEIGDNGKLTDELELTEIHVNAALADDLFRPAGQGDAASPGSDELQGEKDPLAIDLRSIESASVGDVKLDAWYALQISKDAALVIWKRTPPADPATGDPLADLSITFSNPGKERPARHIWVDQAKRADEWSWTLVVTADGKSIGPSAINMIMKIKRNRLTLSFPALWFNDRDLEQIVLAAQPPASGRSPEVTSLHDLRELARKLPASGSK